MSTQPLRSDGNKSKLLSRCALARAALAVAGLGVAIGVAVAASFTLLVAALAYVPRELFASCSDLSVVPLLLWLLGRRRHLLPRRPWLLRLREERAQHLLPPAHPTHQRRHGSNGRNGGTGAGTQFRATTLPRSFAMTPSHRPPGLDLRVDKHTDWDVSPALRTAQGRAGLWFEWSEWGMTEPEFNVTDSHLFERIHTIIYHM